MPKLSNAELFGVLGSIFSIASVFLYGIDKLFSTGNSLIVIGFIALVVSMILIFIFYVIKLKNEYKKLNKNNLEKLKESYKFFHTITHSFRDSIWKIQNLQQDFDQRKELSNGLSQKDLHDYVHEKSFSIFKSFADSITGTIVESLKTLFNVDNIEENFRITIKLLNPESDKDIKEWSVTTACRDPISITKVNKDAEKPSIIGENTDFYEIAYAGKRVFASNNLSDLAKRDSYKNSSTNWQNRYNSTIVLPIRYILDEKIDKIIIDKKKKVFEKPVDAKNPRIIYGFLAADSLNVKNNNLFSDDLNTPIVNLIAHSADLLAIWFRYWEQHCEKLNLSN